ncbi:hypothetical protein L228DRAFT_283759 [Xylona heveae TC161]|uniref:CID domain-containing protein n=1 Tax=Xylona heveae (strain CBS 132557 / TC161) TaxID=1328760 RepID=A0A165G0Z4_XYLHT|nr:hypothetical protein L228DRAFT_283759 [Xylona heveae TC161]KZF21612.1 hypothetical protein L228DRAFT_283759 [Xylona heveae TC161]
MAAAGSSYFVKWFTNYRPSLLKPNFCLDPIELPAAAASPSKKRPGKLGYILAYKTRPDTQNGWPPYPPEWILTFPERKHTGLKESSKDPFLPVFLYDMADPFEVRMRFTSQLQHLNASVTSSQKAAHYALKYRDMDEDLHSCILEQLERNSMNNRANIMFFIEHLCDMAQKENHGEFIRMMQRDILRVVDAVAPEDGSGAANIKVVRRVLSGLRQKGVLTEEGLAEIEACLKERDTLPTHSAFGSPQSNAKAAATTPHGTKVMDIPKPEKRQIEQRIEEDRERHKRLRENIWAVIPENDAEFYKLCDDLSDIGEDDYIMAGEEAADRSTAVAEYMRSMQGTSN